MPCEAGMLWGEYLLWSPITGRPNHLALFEGFPKLSAARKKHRAAQETPCVPRPSRKVSAGRRTAPHGGNGPKRSVQNWPIMANGPSPGALLLEFRAPLGTI